VNRLTCEWFQGWIDEVRICDVALDPEEFLFAPRSQEKHPARSVAKAAGTTRAAPPGGRLSPQSNQKVTMKCALPQ
jgi:hypothetical protein